MSYKGKYKVRDRSKYVGEVDNVVYRSLWERNFMRWCDTNSRIIAWNSEGVVIPYYSPVDNKMHKYYVDFLIKTRDSDGNIKHTLIEVKPEKQCKPPVMGKTQKSKYRYLKELKTWRVNEAKWKEAEEFCKDRKWEFKILTEKQLVK
jgi:hypothetical protein